MHESYLLCVYLLNELSNLGIIWVDLFSAEGQRRDRLIPKHDGRDEYVYNSAHRPIFDCSILIRMLAFKLQVIESNWELEKGTSSLPAIPATLFDSMVKSSMTPILPVPDNIAEKMKGLGQRTVAIKADVSRPADIEQLFEKAIDRFGSWTSSSATRAWSTSPRSRT